ncbi:hypothetical protein KM043_018487 [Ampulex compressa]|nr:hypothetical protein KM043_018487 [Ampulex compressa]
MGFSHYLTVVTLVLVSLIISNQRYVSTAEPLNPLTFIQDFIQHNVAGVPTIHQATEWDFDPEVGKKRRVRYEEENGRRGELAIAKIGMGIGYKGPWGTYV